MQEIQVQAKADAEEAGRRQVLIAELESRKNALNLKRKVLDEAFAAAETNQATAPGRLGKADRQTGGPGRRDRQRKVILYRQQIKLDTRADS